MSSRTRPKWIGQADRVVLDQRERRLGRGEVGDEFLEYRAKVVVCDRLRVADSPGRAAANGIIPPDDVGLQSMLVKPLDKMFDRADKLDCPQAEPGPAVVGLVPEYRIQSFLAPRRSPEIKYFSVTWRSSAAGA